MANAYDVGSLIRQVYRMESIATSSQTFNEEDIIEFLNMELQSTVTPVIQSVNEEFGVMSYDIEVASLPNTVRIPSYATGARLRSVQLINSQGLIQNVPRLDPDKIGQLNFWAQGFYIKNNELVFYPTPPVFQGTLRLNYFRRSNKLVEQLATGRIINIDLIGNLVTLDNSPTPTADWTTGTVCDVIIGESPFDFRLRDVTLVNATGAVLEVDNDVITELQVGDYFALAGETPVAQFIPAEATFYLCQLAGARCLQALGDTEGYQVAMNKAESMRTMLLNMISDRIQGQPKRLTALGMGKRRNMNWNWGW